MSTTPRLAGCTWEHCFRMEPSIKWDDDGVVYGELSCFHQGIASSRRQRDRLPDKTKRDEWRCRHVHRDILSATSRVPVDPEALWLGQVDRMMDTVLVRLRGEKSGSVATFHHG